MNCPNCRGVGCKSYGSFCPMCGRSSCPVCGGTGKHPYNGPFRTVTFFSPDDDFVQVNFSDESSYATQLNSEVTIERSVTTNQIVGVKIHGIRKMVVHD